MNTKNVRDTSRREFLKNTGRVAAASVLAGVAIPAVHAAENNTIRLALVGCGGRGTGAAANALAAKSGPIKLVAMADVFEHRLKGSHRALKRAGGGAASLSFLFCQSSPGLNLPLGWNAPFDRHIASQAKRMPCGTCLPLSTASRLSIIICRPISIQ